MSNGLTGSCSPGDGSAASSKTRKQVGTTPGGEETLTIYESFDDMGLQEGLMRGIYGYGFEHPSSIQKKAIVPLMQGKDMIGQAEAGSGKTAAFLIGLLERIDLSRRVTQAIIMAPVRELAKQIYDVCRGLSQYQEGFTTHCLTGGSSVRADISALRDGVMVAVATPGRLRHMIDQRHLLTHDLKVIVLDEADELLSRGFQDDIYEIFQLLPPDIQACLFSATMPEDIVALSRKFLRNPVHIRVENKDLNRLDCVAQFYIDVEHDRNKLQTLMDIYGALNVNQSMIFLNSKKRCDELYRDLEARDFTCQIIHGGMEQQERDLAMRSFKSGSARVLLSTGLLKRGIDVQSVNLVVNYDLPHSKEIYIHAVGRVGRYGRKGVAINLLGGPRDIENLREIERFYDTEVREMPEPGEVAHFM